MNYRPATAADVGRYDVEVCNGIAPWKKICELRDYREGETFKFSAGGGQWYRYARVPILPEECSHEWVRIDTEADYWKCGKCGAPPFKKRANSVPIEPQMAQLNAPTSVDSAPVHAIRRKLEAGGLAEAEQAILLDGRYYPVEWVKSSPGVLPQQCEIV